VPATSSATSRRLAQDGQAKTRAIRTHLPLRVHPSAPALWGIRSERHGAGRSTRRLLLSCLRSGQSTKKMVVNRVPIRVLLSVARRVSRLVTVNAGMTFTAFLYPSFPNGDMGPLLPCHCIFCNNASPTWRQCRQRHTYTQIVPRWIVVVPPPLIVAAVDSEAIQQIAVCGGLIHKRLAGEEVLRDVRQVLGCQLRKRFGIVAVLTLVRPEGEGGVKVAPSLLKAIIRVLHRREPWPIPANQNLAHRLATRFGCGSRERSRLGKLFLPSKQPVKEIWHFGTFLLACRELVKVLFS